MSSALTNPAHHAVAVTPNDSTDIVETRGIYVGSSGDIKVNMASGASAVIFAGLAAGYVHPLRVTRVYSADTTASSIVALY